LVVPHSRTQQEIGDHRIHDFNWCCARFSWRIAFQPLWVLRPGRCCCCTYTSHFLSFCKVPSPPVTNLNFCFLSSSKLLAWSWFKSSCTTLRWIRSFRCTTTPRYALPSTCVSCPLQKVSRRSMTCTSWASSSCLATHPSHSCSMWPQYSWSAWVADLFWPWLVSSRWDTSLSPYFGMLFSFGFLIRGCKRPLRVKRLGNVFYGFHRSGFHSRVLSFDIFLFSFVPSLLPFFSSCGCQAMARRFWIDLWTALHAQSAGSHEHRGCYEFISHSIILLEGLLQWSCAFVQWQHMSDPQYFWSLYDFFPFLRVIFLDGGLVMILHDVTLNLTPKSFQKISPLRSFVLYALLYCVLFCSGYPIAFHGFWALRCLYESRIVAP